MYIKARTFLVDIYRFFFLHKVLFKLNQYIFLLSLRGIGILNCENDSISGEHSFIESISVILNDSIVIDVGANVGGYSNYISSVSPNANIFSFEPHPETFLILKENAENNNFTAINSACGNEKGTLKLYAYAEKEDSTHSSLYKEVIEEFFSSKSKNWDVEVMTLDTFVVENGIERIRLLKIDTEGNELQVLIGACEIISKDAVDMIHFEFNEMNAFSKTFFKDIYDFLPNYYFYRMFPNSLVSMGSYRPVHWEIFAYQNIVAINKLFLPNVQRYLSL
jgi:FkbM family methyltransferase